jgi:hypothetical protein
LRRGQYDHSFRHFPKKTVPLIVQDICSWAVSLSPDHVLFVADLLHAVHDFAIKRPGDSNSGSIRTAPVKCSAGPLPDGCESLRLISIIHSFVLAWL